MAHVVLIPYGLTSRLNTNLELANRLRRAGHSLTIVSHSDIGPEVADHGHEFVRVVDDERIRQSLPVGQTNPIRRVTDLRRVRQDSITTDEFERVIAGLRPDILLIDIEMHYATIATASLGIPTMLMMNWFSIYRSPGIPPHDSELVPSDDPGTPAEIERAWRRVRLDAHAASVKHKLGRRGVGDLLRSVSYGTNYYADLKRVARSRGYHLGQNTDRRQWLRPYMNTRLPILSFTAQEMDFPHEVHPNLRYAGPMIPPTRPERRFDDNVRRQWNQFLESRERRGTKRPLVYCSLGSYWSDQRFLSTVIDTFRRRSEWDLVLGLGEQVNARDLARLPENVLPLAWAPQLLVLGVADCAITHGGSSTVNECVASEVPMAVYSPGLLDQGGIAARVAYHGLGVMGSWNGGRPQALEGHIAHLLDNREIRANLHTMRRVFDNYRDNDVGVKLVEQQLATGTGPRGDIS